MLLAALLAVTLTPAAGQNKSAVDAWIQRHYEAVALYCRGDTRGALELLGTMTEREQTRAVDAIAAQVSRIAAGLPARREDVVPWPNNAVRALGALHFEAALVAAKGRERDDHQTVSHHAGLAGTLFDLLQRTVKAEDPKALRWITAIGLTQMADGEFADAFRILSPYCDDAKAEALLLVACGTLDETFASLSAEELDRLRPLVQRAHEVLDSRPTLSYAARTLANARSLREWLLKSAEKRFVRALQRNSADVEAQLRLAYVLLQLNQHDRSAALLDKLTAGAGLDARTQYLARLFLGRVRLRQDQLDAAAAALSRLPELQSALLSRAQLAQRRGDAREAAALAARASASAADDPWWGYRFGQYWLIDSLLAQLRAEPCK